MNARDLINLIIFHDYEFAGRNLNVLETIEIARACAIECNTSLSDFLDEYANVIIQQPWSLLPEKMVVLAIARLA